VNSKKRCRICKDYFLVEDFYRPGFCSEKCLKTPARPTKTPVQPRTASSAVRKKPKHRIPVAVRNAVKERDHHYCRMCGNPRNLQAHHCRYLSEGGPDLETNLLMLDAGCHRVVHSDKKFWQPLLLGTLWMEYFNDVHLTIPQYRRWLESVNNP
jgi:hypothetical protein